MRLTPDRAPASDVYSVCPVTGQAVSMRVSPEAVESVELDEVMVSFLEPSRPFGADVIENFCHYVHFFTNEKAGEQWTSGHPGTFLMSLGDAFELGRLTRRGDPHHSCPQT
ncbi:MAG: organomercurial lyase [Actinomycetota bacterium]